MLFIGEKMSDWQPPVGDQWTDLVYINLINRYLEKDQTDLLEDAERFLYPRNGISLLEDIIVWFSDVIKRKLSLLKGTASNRVMIINPDFYFGYYRTDSYLQAAFRIICNDSEVQSYFQSLTTLPSTEKVMRISTFLTEHPAMRKNRFRDRNPQLPVAVLMHKWDIEKVMLCVKQ